MSNIQPDNYTGEDGDEKTDASAFIVTRNPAVEAAARLRADLQKAKPFADGTVVKFTSVGSQNGQHYHYAVIYTAGYWWFTGQGNSFFPSKASHVDFLALLVSRGHLIVDLEVATAFESIELV